MSCIKGNLFAVDDLFTHLHLHFFTLCRNYSFSWKYTTLERVFINSNISRTPRSPICPHDPPAQNPWESRPPTPRIDAYALVQLGHVFDCLAWAHKRFICISKPIYLGMNTPGLPSSGPLGVLVIPQGLQSAPRAHLGDGLTIILWLRLRLHLATHYTLHHGSVRSWSFRFWECY